MRAAGGFAVAAIACLVLATGTASGEPNQRIVGGDVADPADWPFMAALTSRAGQQFCGASVIDVDSVVTAAHCVPRSGKRSNMRVVTGRPDLTDLDAGQRSRVSKIKAHHKYRKIQARDIAVVNLRKPTVSQPVALADETIQANETTEGSELRVAGWGGTERNGDSPSDVLLDVALFAITDEECATYFSFFRPTEEVCAFGAPQGDNKYNDSCFGDSGGPLVADTPGGAYLVGIVSYGGPKCGVDKPGVYQEIARNLKFIERHAG